jgi:hypothetical protein
MSQPKNEKSSMADEKCAGITNSHGEHGRQVTSCVLLSLALFHTGVNACAVFVWIADLLRLELFAFPNLVINLVDFTWSAFTNACGPILALCVTLVSWALAALRAQARGPPVLGAMVAMVGPVARVLALSHTCSQSHLVWALLRWCIRTVFITQDLANVLNVIIVREALLAAFLANVLVASSAFGWVCGGYCSQCLTNGLRLNLGLIHELWIEFNFVCNHIHLLRDCGIAGCAQDNTTVACVHAPLQMMATRRRQCGAIPRLSVCVWHAPLAGGCTSRPVGVLHKARIGDNLAALGLTAICGAVSLTMLKVRVVLLLATLQT